VDYLTGKSRPERLHQVTMALATELLVLSGLANNESAGKQALVRCLEDGRAAEVFAKMVSALGGPSDFMENAGMHLQRAPLSMPVLAMHDGFVSNIDTRALGLAVVSLGGGRRRASDAIDFAVGLSDFAALGVAIKAGDTIAVVSARNEDSANAAVLEVQRAFTIADKAPEKNVIVSRP
jgi:thymidine phosphorylase